MGDENISLAGNFDVLPSDLDTSTTAQIKETKTFDDGELDDDDIISAPIEVLAEFLSAVMSRHYEDALHYCTIILQYEPDNKTAREFYPLIKEKLDLEERSKNNNEEDSDENDSYSRTDNEKSISSLPSNSDNDSGIIEDSTAELSQDLQKINIQ